MLVEVKYMPHNSMYECLIFFNIALPALSIKNKKQTFMQNNDI